MVLRCPSKSNIEVPWPVSVMPEDEAERREEPFGLEAPLWNEGLLCKAGMMLAADVAELNEDEA